MWNCWKTSLACLLICSLSYGCTSGNRPQPQVASHENESAGGEESLGDNEQPELALPLPEGWGPYHPPRLFLQIEGIDAGEGEAASLERGFVLHRVDVERFRILHAREERCSSDLGACELRVSELTTPQFWNSLEGKVLLGAIGFAVGVGTTVGIVIAVQ